MTGPASATSSSRASDHADQSGSSVTRSRRTLESTRVVTSAFAARHGHDLIRAQAFTGMTAQSGKARRAGSLFDLDQNHTPIRGALEVDLAPRTDTKQVTYAFRNGDLTFTGDGGAHGNLRVRTTLFLVLLSLFYA